MKFISTLRLLPLFVAALLFCTSQAAHASSTIYDGEIVEVKKATVRKGGKKIPTLSISIRVRCSPYSSESVHSKIMTRHDGKFTLQQRTLLDFSSFFVDEVPVSLEEMAKILKPGMRVVTYENRSFWYFLRVETRNPSSRMGYLTAIDGEQITLARPQHKYAEGRIMAAEGGHGGRLTEEDGTTHFSDKGYPPFEYQIAVPKTAKVILPDGSIVKRDALGKRIGQGVFYQPARAVQRVELVPANYGDWSLVTENDNFLGRIPQMQYSSVSIMLSTGFERRRVTISPPHNKEPNQRNAKVFDAYLLNGWREPGMVTIPIYHKGEANIVDGFYSNRFNFRHLLLKPGRTVVATTRRRRLTPDALMYSSEMPAAWGKITKIEGDKVTVQAPTIKGVPISGEQTITIAQDAEFVRLGQQIERENVLKLGSLIKVFAAHPARFYMDGPSTKKK